MSDEMLKMLVGLVVAAFSSGGAWAYISSRGSHRLGIRQEERAARRDAVTEWRELFEQARADEARARGELADAMQTISSLTAATNALRTHIATLEADARAKGMNPPPPPETP